MKRIAVFCSGGGSNLQSIIDSCACGLIDGKISLVLVNKKSSFAQKRAVLNEIPSVFISLKKAGSREAFDAQIHAKLLEYKIDVIVTAGYLSIIGNETLAAYEHKIINIHPALLPSFGGMGMYGHHVHEAVLASGAKISGATVHYVTGQVDGGPIILQRAVDVLQSDDPETLAARVLAVEHQLLPAALALHCAGRLCVDGKRVFVK